MINFDEFDTEEKYKDILPGDTVKILPGIGDYIRKYNWDIRMYGIIGKEFIVKSIDIFLTTGEECIYIHSKSGLMWFIPIKFVKKV